MVNVSMGVVVLPDVCLELIQCTQCLFSFFGWDQSCYVLASALCAAVPPEPRRPATPHSTVPCALMAPMNETNE